ncbi:uncharacterized protein DSM5745_08209 [Aspergillus mulundensis]|uniref:Glyoxalase-like domain-containing protein n=1 Tax=Aspergillus mulundensis TaxID=1810919 RepID=A0A3D8R9W1_9EURO|nr:Uncharacterized protein DSM5745_08209 [Aspergillus mulundensis]RDW70698.1 Uncharacterized protein DSM5745_08209 [Aspergillus mulundensis]
MSSQQVYIDHLLLQFSQEQFDPLPSWILDNFTVVDGGVHTGGLSRNKLIVFKDGTYLELYSWITKPDDWRNRLPGDFALTALDPISAEASRERIVKALKSEPGDGNIGVTYLPPREGGRKNAEGVDIQWKIVKARYTQAESTPPDEFYPRGRTDAPFFCHDLTPRKHRVTFDQPSVTQHPSGTTGIDRIEVLVPKDRFRAYTDLYTSIVGASPQETESRAEFKLSAPGVQSFSGSLHIRPAATEADEQFLGEKGVGISALVLRSETGAPFSFPIADYLQ